MGATQVQYQEKRRYPRVSCDLGVEVRVADSNAGYWGTLSDICLGGCYISTFSPLPTGTSVVLVIKNKNLEVNIAGAVVTSHPGVGMGVQFAALAPQIAEAQLKVLLEQLTQAAS